MPSLVDYEKNQQNKHLSTNLSTRFQRLIIEQLQINIFFFK